MGDERREPPQTRTLDVDPGVGWTRDATPPEVGPSQALLAPCNVPRVGALDIGSDIGRYRIAALLGSGGMGHVYCAHDRLLDRMVALKVLKRQTASAERLRREAQALGRLNHPNVVSVYEVGAVEGCTYVAMEYVHGVTLRNWLELQPRALREIVAVFIAAGRGLDAAHATGIVHRDFKPENVLVGEDGRVRVLDFGISWTISKESDEASGPTGQTTLGLGTTSDVDVSHGATQQVRLTRAGALVGTPYYMAPEQFVGAEVGPESDQFSFCAALYEAVYGELPFPGASLEAIFEAIVDGRMRTPARKQSRRLLSALRRGLSVSPRDRHASLASLLAELEALTRPRLWTPIVLLGLGSGAALALGNVETASEPCLAAVELQKAWNGVVSPTSERAFAAVGSFGESQWQRIEGKLDDYVTAWGSSYDALCRADGDAHTSDTLDDSMRCLFDGRRRFDAVTKVLGKADEAAISRAHHLVRELGDPRDCVLATSSRGTAQQPNPQWEADAAYVEVLIVAGGYSTAQPLAQSLVRRADEDRKARALLLLGRVQVETARPEQARETLENAALTARSRGDERVFAAASLELASHLAQTLERHDAASTWLRHAWAAVPVRGDRELQPRLFSVAGRIELGLGNYDEALRQQERALALLEGATDSELYATIKSNIGRVLLQQGRNDEAVRAYRDAYEASQAALGDEHPDVAIPLNNLASAYSQIQNYALARTVREDVLRRWTAAYGSDHPKVALALHRLGEEETRFPDKLVAARAHLEQALEIRQSVFGPEHPETAKTESGLARALRIAGDWDGCIEYGLRAVTHLEQAFGLDHVAVASPLSHLAYCAIARGDAQSAARYARRTLTLLERDYGSDEISLLVALQPLAEAEHAMGRKNEAVAAYRRALAIALVRDSVEGTLVAEVRFCLARILGKTREGVALAQLARATYERLAPERYMARDKLREVQAWLDATVRGER